MDQQLTGVQIVYVVMGALGLGTLAAILIVMAGLGGSDD